MNGFRITHGLYFLIEVDSRPVSGPVFQFEEFELHCGRFQLLRRGRPLRVEPKPLELLILLVSRGGHLVSRREIVEKLWERDVFVDTDHSINTAIRKLRHLLRDDPETPKYIQTVTGMGYRFVAPTTVIEAAVPTATEPPLSEPPPIVTPSPELATTDELHQPSAPATAATLSAESSRRTGRTARLWLLAAAGALAATLLVSLSGSSRSPTIPLAMQQITFTGDRKDGGMVSDGARLYFQSDGRPVEMSVTGGSVQPLQASVLGMTILDISPDASQLLMLKPDLIDETGRGSLWTVPVLGGSPRRLGNLMARGASWSPDGRWLGYADLNSVFISDANGENSREIWNANRTVEGSPRFSPDSKRIRVTVDGKKPDEPMRIFELNADGSKVHLLAPDWPADAQQWDGQWTPDGRHSVFTSNRGLFSSAWELISPPWFAFWKKASAIPLTPEQMDVIATTPARDSASLLVIGSVAQGSMEAYDSREHRFIPFLDGLAASSFVISRDRQWMAYVDYPRHLLWRSRLDGSEKLPLTEIPAWMPEWSPDGKWVTFCNFKAIYRVSVDGGAPEQLTSGSELEISPTWSPDGTSIEFSDFPDPGHLTGIKILDLASRKVSAWPGSEGAYVPSWSPDGKYMVAIANQPKRMVVYSRDTKTWKTLRPFAGDWGFWKWSGDSRSLLMAKIVGAPQPESRPGIYRLTIADARWTPVATLDGLRVSSSPFENFLSITSDGRPAMMSDTSVVQIYSLRWSPR